MIRGLDPHVRVLADQAFSRAAGAPLVAGNTVRLLRDAAENYPAWLDAICSAERYIHFEMYIVHDDGVGREFAEALAARARAGVRVRLVYDWLGALGKTRGRFWRRLREAGVEVRCFNPPTAAHPFDWLRRNHRKAIVVDGRVAFVTGLCVGEMWVGDRARGLEPWRDTGVEIRGPAVADVEHAFAETWAETGPALPPDEQPAAADLPHVGDVALRVVAGTSFSTGTFRLDTLVAALARRTLWLTDAYYAGTSIYVQALRAAAEDGVDVRLLVPGGTDIALVQAVSRAGYRALLEAGVRVFEWNGSMLHAKTAVADGRWSRVGSTNLNVASWLGNWELDVVVEDERFGARLEETYLSDLEHATEIVLEKRGRGRRAATPPRGRLSRVRGPRGSAGRATAGALRLGHAVGAAITRRRRLGPAEAGLMLAAGLLLVAVAVVAYVWPVAVAAPVVVLAAWMGATLVVRSVRLWREHRSHRGDGNPPASASR